MYCFTSNVKLILSFDAIIIIIKKNKILYQKSLTGRKIGIFRRPNKLFSGNSLKKDSCKQRFTTHSGRNGSNLSCAKGTKD